jgi:hypothetical protein
MEDELRAKTQEVLEMLFKRNPDGRGLVMGTKEEIDPLRPCP